MDWEDAAVGDPLSDVANCRLEPRYDHGEQGAEAFTRECAKHSGWPLKELPFKDIYDAAAKPERSLAVAF